ncbi:MAG: RdgB/HAM1 family non-canonical purine NTP pyrophosphatase [Oscillospiraceae bacterium]|nr:RdgB/HAM1 family non-canonical purine NTP pyrophosphatase [Oscillospiraceae bacterium]
MELIIASNNPGKIREYRDIFEPLGYRVCSQDEKDIHLEVEETGSSFEENAILKAKAVYDLTHCCVISDDSGLEVRALHGEPGIRSARYKGLKSEHDRRAAILESLKGCDDRRARFVTCICFIDEHGEQHLFKGVWNGTIAEEESGDNGFGYDPIFISDDAGGKTTASLPLSFKEACSHRAKAVKALLVFLESGTRELRR